MTVEGVTVFAARAGHIAPKLQVAREREEEDQTSLTYPRAVVTLGSERICLAELKQYLGEQEKTDIRMIPRHEQLERLMDGENKPPDSKPSA
jgi:hypothetical protein